MRRWGWLACALICSLAVGACDKTDEKNVSTELADRLSDAMDFENGTPKDAPPPAEHAGDADYPQVTRFEAPVILAGGDDFTIDLMTDFADTASIVGAVVYVNGAKQYVEVAQPYDDASGRVRLNGSMSEDDELAGHAFIVDLALLDDGGEVGNYVQWEVNMPGGGGGGDGGGTRAPFEYGPSVWTWNGYQGGTWMEGGRSRFTYDGSERMSRADHESNEGGTWVADEWETCTYDADGHIEECEEWGDDEDTGEVTLQGRDVYAYDADGRLESKTDYRWEADAWVEDDRDRYTYDGQGRLEAKVYENWSGGAWSEDGVSTHEYDGQNRLVASSSVYGGTEESRHEYEYDSAGRILRITDYYEDGAGLVPEEVIEVTYDANGRVATMAGSGDSEDFGFRRSYIYDDNGRVKTVYDEYEDEEEEGNRTRETSRMDVSTTSDGSSNIFGFHDDPEPFQFWVLYYWGRGLCSKYAQ